MKKQEIKEMDIVFLLDRSGSMGGMESDTIGGYNSYIKSHLDKNAKVTTVLFDDQYELLTNRTDIKDIKELTNTDYYVRGCTALLDAIGKTIKLMDKSGSKKVMFVITTDGYENASKEYNKSQIKELIEGHKNWEFVYIGADVDSYGEAASLGIKKTNTANYKKTKDGTRDMFCAVGKLSSMMFKEEEITEEWKSELE